MRTIHEASTKEREAHVTLCKYRYLNNVSHFHRDHELIYIHNGEATVTVSGEPFRLSSGNSILVHSNDIHYIQSLKETVISVIKADESFFAPILSGKRFFSPLLCGYYEMDNILSELSRETKGSLAYADVAADSIVTRLFISIVRQEPFTEKNDSGTSRAGVNELYIKISEKLIRDYATVTFDEAAEYMHFSRPYFSKIFNGIFGMSFTQYLNTLRVSFAIDKLQNTNMSITDVSASCGFNTIRNFNRVFKSMTGYSPNRLPPDYVFIYNIDGESGLDPTLNCTEIIM